MAAVTIDDIGDRVADWLHREESGVADGDKVFGDTQRFFCVNMARREILGRFDLRWGEATLSISGTQTDYTEDIPTLWKKPRGKRRRKGLNADMFWYDSTEQGLKYPRYVEITEWWELYPDPTDATFQGPPAVWALDADKIYYTPLDASYTLKLLHYAFLASLTTGESDDFLVQAEMAITWNAVGIAQDYFPGDEQYDIKWESKAERFMNDLWIESSRHSGQARPQSRPIPGHRR